MTHAVILAQGTGSKMWPLAATRPKAALPVGGAALLRQQIASLEDVGMAHVTVVGSSACAARLKYLVAGRGDLARGAAGLMRALGSDTDRPRRAQVEVLALDPARGTAIALRQALEHVSDEHVLVLYGDVLFDPATWLRLLAAHEQEPDTPLVLAVPLDALDEPSAHLCVRVQAGRVEDVLAHPRHNVTHRLGGAFVFPRRVILPYLEAHPGYVAALPSGGMPPSGEADLCQSLQMLVEDGVPVRAVEPAGLALDLDRPWDVLSANYAWLELCGRGLERDWIHPTARVSERAEIHGHLVLGENAVIGPGVIVEGNAWIEHDALVTHGVILGSNVHVGPRCRVQDYAWIGEHTSLGPRCKISHCAEVHGVLLGRSTIMHYCEVWGVLGEATDIGAGTAFGTLRFDDQPQAHRVKGRWETPRQASTASFIGDFCRTGVNVVLQPGSKVGAYTVIGPGVVVQGDVPERSLLLLKQEVERREWGPEKYGW